MTVLSPPAPVYELETKKLWTLANFRALPEGPPFYELDDGELIEMAQPRLVHQQIVFELAYILRHYVKTHKNGKVWGDVEVQLSDSKVYVPDLCFVSNEREFIADHELALEGVPDLVIEVLSPSTRSRDLKRKLRVYQQSGARYYWVIDPRDEEMWEYKNTADGFAIKQYTMIDEPFAPELFPELTFTLRDLLEG